MLCVSGVCHWRWIVCVACCWFCIGAARSLARTDGIAFDRTTLERVRKGMELAKSSVRIDIHQSNDGGCKDGGWGSPALKYMQHFAFADSLWFGEGFDYWHQSADWWLLETSGLPYGLVGDMIREGPVGEDGAENLASCPDPNRWLGMVFGMTARGTTGLATTADSPEALEVYPLWKYQAANRMADATLHGWWEDEPVVAVLGPDTTVKATAFVQLDGSGVVAVGNFGNASAAFQLGGPLFAHKTVTLVADAIEAFQPSASFAPGARITVAAKRGWLLRWSK